MHVEVDQSVKLENTAKATVIALANGKTHIIVIPASVKVVCIERLRSRGIESFRQITMLFATSLYLLLKEHMGELQQIVVDVEYQGHTEFIKSHLMNLFRRDGLIVRSDQIVFAHVGKESPAHKTAILVTRRKRRPDRIISEEEILQEL
jgi:hypothetical protein